MARPTIPSARDAEKVRRTLDSPEFKSLIADLQATRLTGRPGYPVRAMLGITLIKSMYCVPVWTRVVTLVKDHAALRDVLGCAPSLSACYRFQEKFRTDPTLVNRCATAIQRALRELRPEYGSGAIAIDGSSLPAYANGQRHVRKGGPLREKFSDPDAGWGHRSAVSNMPSGSYYGYKIHAVVCTETDLPIVWTTLSASAAESPQVPDLLDATLGAGFQPKFAVMDKGYDGVPVYNACEERHIRPIIKLKKTASVMNGKHLPPSCQHGTWKFGGSSDTKQRKASKWRCPTGECTPASKWITPDRLHTLVPRSTERWGKLYAKRGAVEREFGRLKHEWGMLPLRTRTLRRVRTHVDLTILACLASALDDARLAAYPLAA